MCRREPEEENKKHLEYTKLQFNNAIIFNRKYEENHDLPANIEYFLTKKFKTLKFG